MKKNFFAPIVAVSAAVMVFMSCIKNDATNTPTCTDVAPTADSAALLGFANANGVGPLQDTLGLYYQIVTQGSGATPTANSIVYVTYTAELMNGTIFDSTTNSANTGFALANLIPGWQLLLPKIQTGGHIRMLIPSAYAYGCQGSQGSSVAIAPNSPVYFDVNLVSVQ